MGLSCLGSYLNAKGHEAKIFNADYAGETKPLDYRALYNNFALYLNRLRDPKDEIWHSALDEIKSFSPDVAGITIKTGSYRSACNIARLIKEEQPRTVVVAGGPHPSILPEEVAREGCFDFVVKGEGEIAFSALLEKLQAGEAPREVAGITYHEDGESFNNPPGPFISDLDALPFPEREEHLHRELYPREAFGLIATSRGCPFQCTYCASEKLWHRKVRFRSAANVMEEIESVRSRFGTTHFKFRDDTFNLNKKRTIELCDLFIKAGGGITWQCDVRADCMDEEIAAKMRAAGCIATSIGIESGSARILEQIRKGETKEQIQKGAALVKKHGMNIGAFVMFGFPSETTDEMQETLRFTIGLKPDHIIPSIVTPYPGTRIYDDALAGGLLRESSAWEEWFHQSPEMGLAEDRESLHLTIQKMFAEIERYNRSPGRRLKKLASQLWQNPAALKRKFIRVTERLRTKQ